MKPVIKRFFCGFWPLRIHKAALSHYNLSSSVTFTPFSSLFFSALVEKTKNFVFLPITTNSLEVPVCQRHSILMRPQKRAFRTQKLLVVFNKNSQSETNTSPSTFDHSENVYGGRRDGHACCWSMTIPLARPSWFCRPDLQGKDHATDRKKVLTLDKCTSFSFSTESAFVSSESWGTLPISYSDRQVMKRFPNGDNTTHKLMRENKKHNFTDLISRRCFWFVLRRLWRWTPYKTQKVRRVPAPHNLGSVIQWRVGC